MKFIPLLALGSLCQTLAAAPDPAPAVKLDPAMKMVALHNGVNAIDIDGDGREDMVTVAWRENYNAHGFEVSTIYIWASANKDQPLALNIVPRELPPVGQGGDKADPLNNPLSLIASGGADALLHDFRLFVDAAHLSAILITANRRYGESLADTQPVEFEYCQLTRNEEGIPGSATWYFKSFRKVLSRQKHQDVNEAFKSELGIASDGRHPAE